MDRRLFLQKGALTSLTTATPFVPSDPSPRGGPFVGVRVRVSRPTDKLEEVATFYRDAIGLPELGRFGPHEGYTGILLGIPDDHIHLEFTHADQGSPCPAPTKDNLLVLYFDDQTRYTQVLERIKWHGHVPVEPANPYWSRGRSVTFEDPDGWRVVLYHGRPIGAGY